MAITEIFRRYFESFIVAFERLAIVSLAIINRTNIVEESGNIRMVLTGNFGKYFESLVVVFERLAIVSLAKINQT